MAHRKVSHARQNNAASRTSPGAALQAPAPGHSATLTGVQKADLKHAPSGAWSFRDADYDADRQETNPAFQYYPLVIV